MPMGPGELQDLENVGSFKEIDEDRLTVSEVIALHLIKTAVSYQAERVDRIRAVRTLMELCPSEADDVLILTKDTITFEQAELILNTLDSESGPLS